MTEAPSLELTANSRPVCYESRGCCQVCPFPRRDEDLATPLQAKVLRSTLFCGKSKEEVHSARMERREHEIHAGKNIQKIDPGGAFYCYDITDT